MKAEVIVWASLLASVAAGRALCNRVGASAPPEPPRCAVRVQLRDRDSALLTCAVGGIDGDRLTADGAAPGRMAGPALRLLGLPVDVNRAAVEDLQALPGVGPKLAERIAAARPFRCPSDLQRVQGIGRKRWADLENAVTIGEGRRSCADHL